MPPATALRIPVLSPAVQDAAQAIRHAWSTRPRVGLILGTGLGGLAAAIDAEAAIPYDQIPHFPRSTALSHRGRLVCGRLAGVPVVAMEGRCHLYEGYGLAELLIPVFALRELGVRRLVLSNASGGLNPQFRSGDVMVMEDHLNLLFHSRWPFAHATSEDGNAATIDDRLRVGWPQSGRTPYCPRLIELALEVARRENFTAHRGVYAAVTGPNYETRAEYRFLRRIGADVVGMSTVPEALAAAHVGLPTIGLSVVTNVARPDTPDTVDPEDVVRAAASAEPHLRSIALAVVASA